MISPSGPQVVVAQWINAVMSGDVATVWELTDRPWREVWVNRFTAETGQPEARDHLLEHGPAAGKLWDQFSSWWVESHRERGGMRGWETFFAGPWGFWSEHEVGDFPDFEIVRVLEMQSASQPEPVEAGEPRPSLTFLTHYVEGRWLVAADRETPITP